MTRSRSAFLALSLLALVAATSCNKAAPTEPTQSAALAPRIQGVSPATPIQSGAPQQLSVNGTNFLAGMTLIVIAPSNTTTVVGPDEIINRQTAHFEVAVMFQEAGVYQLIVKAADGAQSSPFPIAVQTQSTTLQVTGIAPAVLTRATSQQVLTVTGAQFMSGLTVRLTTPSGFSVAVDQSAITNVSPTGFQMSVTLTAPGLYSVVVTNPNGETAGPVTFVVL